MDACAHTFTYIDGLDPSVSFPFFSLTKEVVYGCRDGLDGDNRFQIHGHTNMTVRDGFCRGAAPSWNILLQGYAWTWRELSAQLHYLHDSKICI